VAVGAGSFLTQESPPTTKDRSRKRDGEIHGSGSETARPVEWNDNAKHEVKLFIFGEFVCENRKLTI